MDQNIFEKLLVLEKIKLKGEIKKSLKTFYH